MLFTKRRKFVFASILLSLGLLVTQFVGQEWRYGVIAGLSAAAGLMTLWALAGDLKGASWYMVPILPITYPVSVALFYFLLPEKFLIRAIIMVLFGIGMYAILLTENIYTVASLRTIQLVRAAQAVGFLLTLLSAFFLLDSIFSFKLAPWWNAGIIGLALFPLLLHGVWCINLDDKLSSKVIGYAGVLAFGLAQLGLMISFWPVSIVVASLFLVTVIYVGLGLVQHELSGRLFKDTLKEYAQVGVVVLIITFLAARWGG